MSTRVALISLYPSGRYRHSGRSGVASYTAHLAHALADAGAQVTVVAQKEPGEPDKSTDGDVVIERVFGRGIRSLAKATDAALRLDAEIVHLQWETFLYGGAPTLATLAPALMSLRLAGCKVVTTLHHVVDPPDVDRSFVRMNQVRVPAWLARVGLRVVQATLVRLSDAVVVHEPAFRNVIAKSVVIKPGLERIPPVDRSQARLELGVTKPAALCFGFIAPYKGIETALDAAVAAGGAFELIVAGGDHPRLDGDAYTRTLRERAPDVSRFTGFVPEPLIAKWFRACDVALFPYPQPFGSSGALALALACETPVLLSSPFARCLHAEPSLVMPAEPASLAREVERVCTNSLRRQDVAAASARLADGRSWPSAATSHLDLYEEVILANRATRGSVRTG